MATIMRRSNNILNVNNIANTFKYESLRAYAERTRPSAPKKDTILFGRAQVLALVKAGILRPEDAIEEFVEFRNHYVVEFNHKDHFRYLCPKKDTCVFTRRQVKYLLEKEVVELDWFEILDENRYTFKF